MNLLLRRIACMSSRVCSRKMNFVLAVFIVVALAAVANAETLAFDDLDPSQSSVIPDGYGGLNWTNVNVVDGTNYGVNYGTPSGYEHGVISPRNVAFNAGGYPAEISGAPFAFDSAYFTAAWKDGLNVQVVGYLVGTIVETANFVVDTSGPTLKTFNWPEVDTVTFTTSGGTPHGYIVGGLPADEGQFAMDDFRFTPVPEPSSLSLLISAIVGSAIVYLRPRLAAIAGLSRRHKGNSASTYPMQK
jgi:hypothetical protein